MAKGYDVDYDRAARLLKLTLSGLWDEAVLAGFVGELVAVRQQADRLGPLDDRARILIDLSGYVVQPQAIAQVLAELLPRFGDHAGRVAVVRSASALQQLQTQRLLTSDKVRMFDDAVAGLAWLRA